MKEPVTISVQKAYFDRQFRMESYPNWTEHLI